MPCNDKQRFATFMTALLLLIISGFVSAQDEIIDLRRFIYDFFKSFLEF